MSKITLSPLAIAVVLASSTQASDKNARATFTLDKVTIAATLNEQKIGDVANTVSVIDAESIEKHFATNIREMLRYEPGVDVSNTGRFGLSGINVRGLNGNRVKILVDGVEQAKDFNSGGPFLRGTRNFVDVDSLKQVEILKGPASSLYGSDALGGVVAFTTKDAADYLADGDDTTTSLKVGYNSVDESTNETITFANRSGRLESLLVYTRRDGSESKNYEDGYQGGQGNARTKADPVEFGGNNILGKLSYQLNDQHRFGITAEYQNTDTETELPSLEGPGYSVMFNYSDYTGEDTNTRKRVGVWHEINTETTLFDQLEWKLDWQDSVTEQLTFNTTAFAGYGPRKIDYDNTEENTQFSLRLSKAAGAHLMTYGANWQDSEFQNNTNKFYLEGTRPDDIQRYTPVVEGATWGIFLQDQITLMNGNLLVTPGIRYDSFSAEPGTDEVFTREFEDHDSDKWTARLGTVYKFSENYSVFAQLSQGFKAPDLVQLYREDSASINRGYITLANPNLKPEESTSLEVGLRSTGDWGQFEISAYYNDYADFIDTDTYYENMNGRDIRVTQYQNLSEAEIKGVEARTSIWLDQAMDAPLGTSLHASFAWSEGEGQKDGESKRPIDTIAPLKAVIGVDYDNPGGIWGGSAHWTLVASKDESDISDETETTTHGFGIFDLTGYYNVNQQLVIRGGIYNLADKEYSLWEDIRGRPANTTYLDRYTQAGRNFSISATYSF